MTNPYALPFPTAPLPGTDSGAIEVDAAGSSVGTAFTKVNFVSGFAVTDAGGGKANVDNTGAGGSGEANTASNAGTAGVGVVLTKSGVNLPFKAIAAASNKLTATDNATTKTVDLDVVEGNFAFTGLERTANKGATSGYASLDSGTKIPIAQIPTGTSGATVALGNAAPNAHHTTHEAGGSDIVAHQSLSGAGTNTHAQIDTFIASKAAASGLASLDGGTKIPIAQLPTGTPVAVGTANAAGSATTLALSDHVHEAGENIIKKGLTTTGIGAGDVVCWSTTLNTVAKIDSAAGSTMRFAGVSAGVSGEIITFGPATAKLTTGGGQPNNGDPLYPANGGDDSGAGAGKLTATAPTTGIAKLVARCIDNALYASAKTCVVELVDHASISINTAGSDTHVLKRTGSSPVEHDPTADKFRFAGLGIGAACSSTAGLLTMATAVPQAVGDIGMDAPSGRPQVFVGGAAHKLAHVDEMPSIALARLYALGNGIDGTNNALGGAMDRDFLQIVAGKLTSALTPKSGLGTLMLLCQGTLDLNTFSLNADGKGTAGTSGGAASSGGTGVAGGALSSVNTSMAATVSTKNSTGAGPGGAAGGAGNNATSPSTAGGLNQGGVGGPGGGGGGAATSTNGSGGQIGGVATGSTMSSTLLPRMKRNPDVVASWANTNTGFIWGSGGTGGGSGGSGATGTSGTGGNSAAAGLAGTGGGLVYAAADTFTNGTISSAGTNGTQPAASSNGSLASGGGAGSGGGGGGGGGDILLIYRVLNNVTTSTAGGLGAAPGAPGTSTGTGFSGGLGATAGAGGAGTLTSVAY